MLQKLFNKLNRHKPDLHSLKRSFTATFVIMCLFTGFFVFATWMEMTEDGSIQVQARYVKDNMAAASTPTSHGLFKNESIGTLYLVPENIFQALLYQEESGSDIFMLLYLSILTFLFYFSKRNITDHKLFSKKLQMSFRIASLFTFLYFTIVVTWKQRLQRNMLPKWTDGQFSFDPPANSSIAFLVFVTILAMAAYLVQKGEELQEEQELTV